MTFEGVGETDAIVDVGVARELLLLWYRWCARSGIEDVVRCGRCQYILLAKTALE